MKPQTKNKLRRVLRTLDPQGIGEWVEEAGIEWDGLDEEETNWILDHWDKEQEKETV